MIVFFLHSQCSMRSAEQECQFRKGEVENHFLDQELGQELEINISAGVISRYVIETSGQRSCAANKSLTTEAECREAMSKIVGNESNFTTESNNPSRPIHCYRLTVDPTAWYFNDNDVGTIDVNVQPVCHGNAKRVCLFA